MLADRLHLFPLFIVIYVPLSFCITYIIAVANKHVEPGFPYISDTGTLPPESCVFGQLLNIGAVVAMVMFYIRYKQIATYQKDCPVRIITRVNKAALVMGLFCAFGISLVGNFQETNVVVVHLIGAFFAFGMGLVYCCLQTYLSFKLPDIPGSSRNLQVGRLVICILDLVFILTLMIAASFTVGDMPNNPRKWTPDEPMYGAHLTSTISEWLMAFLTCLYLATFTPEFKYFEMIKPEIMFRDASGISAIRITKDTEQQTSNGPVKFTQSSGET